MAKTSLRLALFLLAFALLFGGSYTWAGPVPPTDNGSAASLAAKTLSGHVYVGDWGTTPPASAPLPGAQVELHGSNYGEATQVFLTSTTTDSEGRYGLTVLGSWEYYFIIEQDPPGYTSVGARSVGGTVCGVNCIRYAPGELGGTLTDNDFWDQRSSERTPTPTVTRPLPTATVTRPPPPTPTPTITRPPQTSTPTPTATPGCGYLIADFDWTIFCAISFTFSDTSATSPSDPINSWQWDFGDGATSTQQNPTHTYSQLGMFDVTLTVRTRDGCQASVTKQVEAAYPE